MRLGELLLFAVRSKGRRQATQSDRPGDRTTYRPRTRRHGGVTFVGVPNKIARRMGIPNHGGYRCRMTSG